MTINTIFLTSFLWLRPKKLVRNDRITLYQLPVDTVYENDEVLARRVLGKFTRRCHTKDDVTVYCRAAVSYKVAACHPDTKRSVVRDLRE